jgi:formate C-acetyltransferase
MSLKTRIKNDLWRVNYILPFVKKYRFGEKGKIDFAKRILSAYKEIKPVRSKERTVGYDTKELLNNIDVVIEEKQRFVYFIDTVIVTF